MRKVSRRRTLNADLDIYLGDPLVESPALATIEELLQVEAREWASDLHIYLEGERPRRREIHQFAADVQTEALEWSEMYRSRYPEDVERPTFRRFGSVELRGAQRSLIVLLGMDEHRFSQISGRYLWGNSVCLQVRGKRVAGIEAAEFMRRFAERACEVLSPLYVFGRLSEDFENKNISREGGGYMAIGRDVSRHLPGLYWLNFFGEPYCSLIGKERLLSAPAHETKEVDGGVLVQLAPDPRELNTPDYQSVEQSVLTHVGREYFFDRNHPRRETVAPDFGLEILTPHPRFA